MNAFYPLGKTIKVAADTTAPIGVQALADSGQKAEQYQIANLGASAVRVGWGTSAVLAQTNAAVPTGTGDDATYAIWLPPGAILILSRPDQTYWSALSVAGSHTGVEITPGRGI